jgi:hypothetical protein
MFFGWLSLFQTKKAAHPAILARGGGRRQSRSDFTASIFGTFLVVGALRPLA